MDRSIYRFIYLFISSFFLFIYLSICRCIYFFIYLCIYLFICLSIHLYLYPVFYSSIDLSVYLSIDVLMYLFYFSIPFYVPALVTKTLANSKKEKTPNHLQKSPQGAWVSLFFANGLGNSAEPRFGSQIGTKSGEKKSRYKCKSTSIDI